MATEYTFENFNIQVGPHNRIDPSDGYVFFTCEHAEEDGTDSEYITIIKRKKEYVAYHFEKGIFDSDKEVGNKDLIHFLKEKANDILESTEPIHKSDLDSERLEGEITNFIEKDLNNNPMDEKVMNFDLGEVLGTLAKGIAAIVKAPFTGEDGRGNKLPGGKIGG